MQDYQDWDEYGYDDHPDYKHEYQNYFSTEQTPNLALTNVNHFKDDAKQQLRLLDLSEEDREVAEYVIDALNNHGLMDKPLDEVADDYSFYLQGLVEVDTIKRGLAIVQTLDPIGIGACSIQECLLLQLRAMDARRPDVKCAIRLVQDHYNDLMHRQFEKNTPCA